MKYDHRKIEKKWQAFWAQQKTFAAANHSEKPKYYVLDMFPYPSGSGLHVGHVEGYTATDVVARYKRAQGFNVLHPMGWDSFGLPAEQYAIRTGTHPAVSTQANIDNFRRQLMSLGFSYDWDREIATSDPTYYKWTQWIFTKLYEQGLAYEAEMLVNYCPALGTVLANEEVENGRSKDGGHLIERRPLKQWILKITAYADRLIQDLDLLDWPESLKKLQVNWIGKSEGVYVDFAEATRDVGLTVFTTRPDTLFGVTYLVMAPEHPLLEQIVAPAQKEQVSAYQKTAAAKSDLDRTDLNLEKSGVFTGAYATHPVSGERLPIWVADYVIFGYGTGIVMGVPAHDERDFAFATQYHLPIRSVYDPGEEIENRSEVMSGLCCWPEPRGRLIHSAAAGVSFDGNTTDDAKQSITEWLEKHAKGKKAITYKLRDWLFSRQRYWGEPFPLLKFEDGTLRLLATDELPLTPPELEDYKPLGDGKSPLSRCDDWVNILDTKTGRPAVRETNIMPQWAGSCWYYLRFCDPHNYVQAWDQDVEKYWMPVDLYVGGVEHAVLHLLYARFWHKVLYDCGYVTTKEPFQKLRNQGIIVARSYQNDTGAYVAPEEVQEKNGRFFHATTGEELRSQIEKMSKSKLNGVTPDEIVEEFGADSLRLYELFMGPLEKEKIWNTDAVSGCRRFLNRFYDMVRSEKIVEQESVEAQKLVHPLIAGVTADLEAMQFNTAIAKMMEFINDFTKLSSYPRSTLMVLTQLLAPFAPHVAEEAWSLLGRTDSLSYATFPVADPKFLIATEAVYVIQVNGKVRARLELPVDLDEEVVFRHAEAHPHVASYLSGAKVVKRIFVKNKLLSLVIA